MKISVAVSKGTGKMECEDNVLVGDNIINDTTGEYDFSEPTVICVADGVGGNKGGRAASEFLLRAVASENLFNLDEIEIKNSLVKINARLIEYAADIKGKENMAATLTGFIADNSRVVWFHSGNTRLYILQGCYLKQITADQTTYQRLMNFGNSAAAETCNKNEINGCFGGGDERYLLQLKTGVLELCGGSCFLMTSDGVHEYVDIDTLEDILNQDESDIDIAARMIEKASENGSTDDKSVVIVRC